MRIAKYMHNPIKWATVFLQIFTGKPTYIQNWSLCLNHGAVDRTSCLTSLSVHEIFSSLIYEWYSGKKTLYQCSNCSAFEQIPCTKFIVVTFFSSQYHSAQTGKAWRVSKTRKSCNSDISNSMAAVDHESVRNTFDQKTSAEMASHKKWWLIRTIHSWTHCNFQVPPSPSQCPKHSVPFFSVTYNINFDRIIC